MKAKFGLVGQDGELKGYAVETDDKQTVLMDVQTLASHNRENRSFSITRKGIIPKKGFSMEGLEYRYCEDNGTILGEADTSLYLRARILKGNEVVGFETMSLAGQKRMTVEQVIVAATWMKPKQFVVRETISKGVVKKFICGKAGYPLSALPQIDVTDLVSTKYPEDRPRHRHGQPANVSAQAEAGAKAQGRDEVGGTRQVIPETIPSGVQPPQIKVKPASKVINSALPAEEMHGNDILKIFEIAKQVGADIVKLPGEDYEAVGERKEAIPKEFLPLRIGEIASADIEFPYTKMNLSAKFKKVGVVNVCVPGGMDTVYTYVWSNKCIFHNGKGHIRRLGAAMSEEKAKEFIESLGERAISVSAIKDTSVTLPISSLTGRKDLALLEIDTGNLDFISPQRMSNAVLSVAKIEALLRMRFLLSMRNKILMAWGKELKKAGIDLWDGESVTSYLKGYPASMIDSIREAGIDIATGAYLRREKIDTDSKKTSASKEPKDSEDIEVEYILDGYDVSKYTGPALLGGKELKLPESSFGPGSREQAEMDYTQKMLGSIQAAVDAESKRKLYIELKKEDRTSNRALQEINKRLWMHRATMVVRSGGKYIHQRNSDQWKPKEGTRRAGSVYQHKDTGLLLVCKGVEIPD